MNVTIREATGNDLDALVTMSLELHAYHEACDPRCRRASEDAPRMEREKVLDMLDDPDGKVVVAEDDEGKVIGMAVGKVERAADHIPPLSGHIRRVFVKEGCRGGGIGCRLLAPLRHFFGGHGVTDIYLHHMVKNDGAGRFWTRLGFQPFLMMAKATLADLADALSE